MRALVVSSDPEHAGALAAALRRGAHEAQVLSVEEALAALGREHARLVMLDLAALHDIAGLVRRLREGTGGSELWVLGVVDPEAQLTGLRSALEAQVDDFVVWPGRDAELSARLKLAEAWAGGTRERREARFPTTFHSLVQRLPVMVGVTALDGRLLYVNPEAVRALGYEREEQLLGERVEELMPREARAEVALRAALLAGGEQPGTRERHLLHRSGRKLDVEMLSFPFHFQGQDALVSVGRDVTERRAQQVQQLTRERLSSVGILAAGLAHQINNPLAYLTSNLTFVREELARGPRDQGSPRVEPQELQDALNEAKEGADRVARIVRDLRSFSREEEEDPGPVDLKHVLETALALAGNELRNRARVVRDYADAPSVWGKPGRLSQVFFNLLVNAAEAIPEGDADHHSVQVAVRRASEGWVSASVRDSGSGIPPEHLERLFAPFFTTKLAGRGTGLGLSICQRLVEELGGEIRVRSVLGQGSTFEVLLPCVPAPTAVVPPPEPTVPERRASVLMLDDDALVCRAFERLLRPYHDVTCFQRARPALDWLGAGAAVDVLFCDLTMPDMGAMDIYCAIADARPELLPRVVLVTGGAFSSQARDFVEALSRRRLDKPFERDQVLALIRQVRSGAEQR